MNKKIRKWPQGKPISIFESEGVNLNKINKIRRLKDAFPEDYEKKMEAHLQELESEVERLRTEVTCLKEDNFTIKDNNEVLAQANQKLNHALKKKTW